MTAPPEQVAAQLTRAQARIVMSMGPEFVDYAAAGIIQRRTRIRLNQLGVTEPQQVGPVTLYCNIRLSALGVAVRDILRAAHVEEARK